jgi:hypothetical protein
VRSACGRLESSAEAPRGGTSRSIDVSTRVVILVGRRVSAASLGCATIAPFPKPMHEQAPTAHQSSTPRSASSVVRLGDAALTLRGRLNRIRVGRVVAGPTHGASRRGTEGSRVRASNTTEHRAGAYKDRAVLYDPAGAVTRLQIISYSDSPSSPSISSVTTGGRRRPCGVGAMIATTALSRGSDGYWTRVRCRRTWEVPITTAERGARCE